MYRYSLREIKKLHEANAVISNYHRHPDDSKIPAVKRAFRILNRIILDNSKAGRLYVARLFLKILYKTL